MPNIINNVFKEITVSALIIGLIVGISSGIFTLTFVTPLILEAEAYEEEGENTHLIEHHSSQDVSQHEPHVELWQRNLITVAGSVLLVSCYSLVLSLIYPFFPLSNCWFRGLLLGFLGFLFFNFIPNLGLPANPPGVEYVSDIAVRQKWWFSLLACEAIFLALCYFLLMKHKKVNFPKKYLLLGIAAFSSIILIPFLIGVPNTMGNSMVPEHLVTNFRQFSTILNLATWVFLGTLVTLFLKAYCKNIPSNLIKS